MIGPLVETKLFLPRARAGTLARPRLTGRLGENTGLVLVSAPAGFGKTTLLERWVAGQNAAVAWISLDADDGSPRTFWTYVITALDRAAPGTGSDAISLLLQAGHSPVEAVLTAVLNELSVFPGDLALVLDDYHLADGPALRPSMEFFVDHLPPQVRLIISTRTDPGLPLARLRARGELTEVRAADLRFTAEEAGDYLTTTTGVKLSAADIGKLAGRTEGWVAALQLAALSLRGRDDAAGFIDGFAGDDRFVVDYLAEEVLDRQSETVRRFLLETSILERLTGNLCDAVTEGTRGRAMLESLERANLFLVPLDDRRRWYRYHHLFRDVLHAHLLDERPDDVAGLHRRAGDWFDRAGDPLPAVRHMLAADDVERAADIIEKAVPELRRHRQEAVLRRWADDVPAEVLARRPVLAIGLVGGLMASNEFGDVDRRLREIEATLAGGDFTVIDQTEFARVPAGIEMYRAALALISGDPAAPITHARTATQLVPEDDHLLRASASALAGLASWTTGDLEAAHRGYAAAAQGLRRVGYVSDVLGCSITLADLELIQGQLHQAHHTYEDALRLAEEHGPAIRGTRDMHVGLSQIAYERGDLAAAAEHLRRSTALGEEAGLPQNPYRWRVAMALLREAEGDRDAAIGLLEDAQRVYVGDFSPDVRPVAALRARMLAANGDIAAALAWARGRDLTSSYLHEYEQLTVARIIAPSAAIPLLENLATAASSGGRHGTLIEILVVLALARRATEDASGARVTVERALALAEPEGFVQVFADAFPLLDELGLTTLAHASAPAPVRAVLIEPLSDRELDVMRLLAGDLDGPSIARHLMVSLNTVRTHTKHIYTKLGVTNRRAAVRRAHELHLLSRR
ncbi:LuxR C-terminal-related transcriptional regulator [Actinoplanes sp. CA-142083]|uniref:LuxR C-terminal-related transcriptional regulator n=1 Tax=Actinoplanes sp. CA-142083 TaxID=3239903 RepID=UPI003D92CA27